MPRILAPGWEAEQTKQLVIIQLLFLPQTARGTPPQDSLLDLDNVAVERATHVLEVREDESLGNVKAACNDVLCILHVQRPAVCV